MRLLPLPVSLRAELSGRLLDGKTIMSTLVTHSEDLQQQSIMSSYIQCFAKRTKSHLLVVSSLCHLTVW